MDAYTSSDVELKAYNFLRSSKMLWNAVSAISTEADIKLSKPYFDELRKSCEEAFPELVKDPGSFDRALKSASLTVYLQKKDLVFL